VNLRAQQECPNDRCHGHNSLLSGTHYLWVARLDDSVKLKVTDPKEQQGDVEEEEAESEERQDCIERGAGC